MKTRTRARRSSERRVDERDRPFVDIEKRDKDARARVCITYRNVPNDNKRMTIAGGALFLFREVSFFEIFLAGSKHFGSEKTHTERKRAKRIHTRDREKRYTCA